MTRTVSGAAVISDCGVYRYELTRQWGGSRLPVCWIMLNPSTADADQDDPTIRRCISFSKEWGFARLVVVNLFALRATDPRALYSHPDPIGPDNDAHITAAIESSGRAIAAWGVHGALKNRGYEVLHGHAGIYHLGLTKNGHPRHPLYVKGDTVPSWDWSR